MAPPTPGARPSTPSGDGTPSSDERALAPFDFEDSHFPAPRDLAVRLCERFEAELRAMREDRGTVTCPEDTFATIRKEYEWKRRAAEYASAFKTVEKRVDAAIKEDHVEAVHDQNGVPLSGMTVPDSGSEIVLSLSFENVYDFDMDQIYTALAQLIADEYYDAGSPLGIEEDMPVILHYGAEMARRAISDLVTSAKPSIKGITALRKLAAHRAADDISATIRTAVSSPRRVYKGVNIEDRPA